MTLRASRYGGVGVSENELHYLETIRIESIIDDHRQDKCKDKYL